MGIFSSIKDAIFGHHASAQPQPQGGAPKPATAQPAATAPAAQAQQPAPAQAQAQAQPMQEVDLEKVLDAKPGADKLNWRSSIVDLMKLVGIDSSFDNRKQLATELGRANYTGSAEDNEWLHQRTMEELEKNGAKVPANLTA
ncbi:MAG TPA: DUF3597 domain-containing protein [Croceibacterium sp.]|jgi:hypothetical protein